MGILLPNHFENSFDQGPAAIMKFFANISVPFVKTTFLTLLFFTINSFILELINFAPFFSAAVNNERENL